MPAHTIGLGFVKRMLPQDLAAKVVGPTNREEGLGTAPGLEPTEGAASSAGGVDCACARRWWTATPAAAAPTRAMAPAIQ
jgi:hypothetical protein